MMKFLKGSYKKIRAKLGPARFANRPRNLVIKEPRTIRGSERITIGDNVFIGQYSLLRAVTKTGPLTRHPEGTHVKQVFDPRIVIGNRVSATASLHLAAHKSITIEDDVLIASNVFISDALHAFGNGEIPYKYQGFARISPILIKRGCWIGQNVVIMPGVTIGEMSIVGANSVVTRSIPDRCIAVGSPARVIKRWDEESRAWVLSDKKDGENELEREERFSGEAA